MHTHLKVLLRGIILKISFCLCTYYLRWMSCFISFKRCKSNWEEHGTSEHYKRILSTAGFEPPRLHDLLITSRPCSPLGQFSNVTSEGIKLNVIRVIYIACTYMCRHIYNWNIVACDVKQSISYPIRSINNLNRCMSISPEFQSYNVWILLKTVLKYLIYQSAKQYWFCITVRLGCNGNYVDAPVQVIDRSYRYSST